jgi:shikimate dehydrogenase
MMHRWRFGLIGRDIAYTKSPELFKAIGQYLGEDIECDVFSVSIEGIPDIVRRFREGEYHGLSVTVPYKYEVLRLIDNVSSTVERIAAVNCIARSDDSLTGHNTDCDGFLKPLGSYLSELRGACVTILGAGGAARAVAFALKHKIGVSEIKVVTRPGSANGERMRHALNEQVTILHTEQAAIRAAVEKSTLIVNAIPLGGRNVLDMSPIPDGVALPARTICYDLSYDTASRFALAAQLAGCTIINGQAMLVEQGLRSFDIWTGRQVPFEPVFKAVFGSKHHK